MENLTFWTIRVWVWIAVLWVGLSGQTAYGSVSNTYNIASDQPSAGMDPVIFHFNCINGEPGDTICIPVTVENFNDVVIAQFEIFWNSDVLDYIDVQNPGTGSINPNSDFNLSGPNALKFIPLGFPINGESLPDGTVLFEVCFRIIGIPGSSSDVGISPFFDFEVADVNGVIPAEFTDCTVMVEDAITLVGFVNSCGPAIAGGNGGIDVTVYGGTPGYTITWVETISGSPGGPVLIPAQGGNMTLNVPEGNYIVTITDLTGTQVMYTIEVDALALSISTRLRHPTCYKFSNGTMWIKPLGGSAPFSYIWASLTNQAYAGSGFIRNAGDSSLVTSLPDGMYRILVKDDNGCEAEITVVLNDNPFVFTVNQLVNATCQGSVDGLINLSISGATPDSDGNYHVIIKPGFELFTNNVSIGLLNPGEHCITVSDIVSQCDTVFCFTIGAANVISATVNPIDPLCAGNANGSVSIRGLTNGIPGMVYSYTIFSSTGAIITNATDIGGTFNYSPLGPGNYLVVIREDDCLSDSIPFTISSPLPLTITVGGTTKDDCLTQFATGTAWFTVTNAVGAYTLSAGAGVQDGDTIRNLNAANYVVTVVDANGCTATANFRIKDGDDDERADITFQVDGNPCEGGTITLLYLGSATLPNNSSVSWNNGQYIGQTITITEGDTLYADLFIPSIHCMLNDTIIINCKDKLELNITVINPVCNDEAVGGPFTGSVIVDTVNAVAPVTWVWSFGDTTLTGLYSGLAPGEYYVTVTDGLDSMVVDTFEIVAPDAIHFLFGVPDSTSCDGICDGGVMITPIDGDPTFDYFIYWTTTGPFADTGSTFQINGLCEGLTKFSLSQDGICFYESEVEIFSPEPIDIDLANSRDATCYGYSDALLEVVGIGGVPGYTYAWGGGPTSALFNGITAGEYTVTVTDSKNCSATGSFTVVQPDSIIAQIDLSATLNLSCGADNDGIITVDVSGGNGGNYTFQWNPNVSTNYQATNLAAGVYDVTVTDILGCSDTTTYRLTSPPPIVVEWPVMAAPACFGDETVLQIDNVTGGSGTYSLSINGGPTFDIGEPILIPSGIYIVSVIDDRGCSSDSTYLVMEPNPILVSIGPDNPVVELGDSLFLSGQVDQSDNPIEMTLWTSVVPVGCPTCYDTWVYNFIPTLYTWTVTDENGCQGSTSIMVGVDLDRNVFVPTVFTPNGDGRNDEFMIFPGNGVKMIHYIYIYDRWGNLVYSISNQMPEASGVGNWDGTNNGEELNPGVYVYIAKVEFIDNNTILTYRGDVTLIK